MEPKRSRKNKGRLSLGFFALHNFMEGKQSLGFLKNRIGQYDLANYRKSLIFPLHFFMGRDKILVFHKVVPLNTVLNPSREVLSRVRAYSRRGRPFS